MRGKPFFLVAFILALPLVGFGCKGMSQEERQATAPVVLEYWTAFDDVDALRVLIDKYKVERPHLTVNLRQLKADELYPRLIEALADDRAPDIISVHNRSLRQFASKLAPMPASVQDTTIQVVKRKLGTETIVNTRPRNLIGPLQLEREYVQAVKQDVLIDGKIYGLPLSVDTMALYYNKDLLDRAGVPEPPKTWDEFQAAVKKVTRYDKKNARIIQSGAALGTGNNISGADDILYILFKQSDIDFVTREGLAAFGTAPQEVIREYTPAMRVINFYTDFANVTRDTYAWNEDMNGALDKFVNGSLGFFFGYSYHYPVIKARAPQLNVEVLPFPQLNPEQPANVANYWAQTVVAKSAHKNEAWALVDYLVHSQATKEYIDATGRPTALRAFVAAQRERVELAPFMDQLLVAENWYRGRDYAAATRAIFTMLHEWLQPPPDADKELEWRQGVLNRAAARVNQTL